MINKCITIFILDTCKKVILANSEDLDEMPNKVVFHWGLHCLQKKEQFFMTEMHHNLEISTCDLNGQPILILLTCMGKSIRIKI